MNQDVGENEKVKFVHLLQEELRRIFVVYCCNICVMSLIYYQLFQVSQDAEEFHEDYMLDAIKYK
jgi:hypothetical protein